MARTAGSHSEVTGPRVRAAALKMFAELGYEAVSMRALAAEVGVQAGALYLYSPDKQTMLFELIHDHLQAMLTEWGAVAKPAGAVAALECFVKFHIGFQLDHPAEVQLCALERRSLAVANRAAIDALMHNYESKLETILRQGHLDKVFTLADPQIAARALLAMLTGIGQWYPDDSKLTRDRVVRIFWNMARKAVGA